MKKESLLKVNLKLNLPGQETNTPTNGVLEFFKAVEVGSNVLVKERYYASLDVEGKDKSYLYVAEKSTTGNFQALIQTLKTLKPEEQSQHIESFFHQPQNKWTLKISPPSMFFTMVLG